MSVWVAVEVRIAKRVLIEMEDGDDVIQRAESEVYDEQSINDGVVEVFSAGKVLPDQLDFELRHADETYPLED